MKWGRKSPGPVRDRCNEGDSTFNNVSGANVGSFMRQRFILREYRLSRHEHRGEILVLRGWIVPAPDMNRIGLRATEMRYAFAMVDVIGGFEPVSDRIDHLLNVAPAQIFIRLDVIERGPDSRQGDLNVQVIVRARGFQQMLNGGVCLVSAAPAVASWFSCSPALG